MKLAAIASIALISVAGMASASPLSLSSGSAVQIDTLAPDLQVETLTPIQIDEINHAVTSDSGLTQSKLITILGS